MAAGVFPLFMVWLTDVRDDQSLNFIENLYARKDALLAEENNGPRLVVVGGSGTLFNVRGEMLEAATGLPTVNYGSHAGLGPHMLLARAKREIRPGDRVLLIPEYSMLSVTPRKPLAVRPWRWACTYDHHALIEAGLMTSLWTAAKAEWPETKDIKERLQKDDVIPPAPRKYPMGALTTRGDLVWQPEQKADLPLAWTNGVPAVDDPDWARYVRDFLDWADRNDVEVAIAWPSCVPDEDVQSLASDMHKVLTQIAEEYEAKLLGTPTDWFLQTHEVSDTGNHATPRAAIDITWRLIDQLERVGWVKSRQASGAFLPGPGSIRPELSRAAFDRNADRSVPSLAGVSEDIQTLYTDDPSVVLLALESGWQVTQCLHPMHDQIRDGLTLSESDILTVTARGAEAARFHWLPVSWSESDPFHTIWSADEQRALGEASPSRSLHEFVAPLQSGKKLSHRIAASASDRQSWITVNDAPLLDRLSASGVGVVVFDQETGTVEHALRFDAKGHPLGNILYEMKRGQTELVEQSIDLDDFIPSGVSKPELSIERRGLRVDFTGDKSFVALPMQVEDIGPGYHWLDLQVYTSKSARFDLFTWTRGDLHLADLTDAVSIPLHPGQNRLIVPVTLDANDPTTALAGLRGNTGSPDVIITSARLVSAGTLIGEGE